MSAGFEVATQTLESAIVDATDPVIAANLRRVAEHVDAEVSGDVDRLMATLVDDPVYHIWGSSKSVGPVGFDQVRTHYQNLARSGKNRLRYEVTRVVADRHCVVTEGYFVLAYPGVVLPAATLPDGTALIDDHWYLVQYKCVVLWPMDGDARIRGEELYAGETPAVVRHLDDHDEPHLGPAGRRNGVVVPGWV
jgi:hypothetical protein